MRLLSSKSTWWYKRGMPVVFFGFVVLVSFIGAREAIAREQSLVPFFLAPLVMSGVLWLVFRRFIVELVDEVWDDGDSLVIKKKSIDETVLLKSVVNVNDLTSVNQPMVTLLLRDPCRFGREVSFVPQGGVKLGRRNPIATELIERIDVLRRSESERPDQTWT